ncbi:MAG: molybdopterin cofactor-binding domain-containing protein [Kofleriaceae bacterium]
MSGGPRPVDVAVDLDSYQVTIERCVHAIDVGKAINPVIVKGQIEGGTLQALGWAVLEDVTYDGGKVKNASMTNCIVPTFADAPELETIIVEVPYPYGPSGAKGVGEIPMDGPAAAVANAVADALGCEFDELPISPEVIGARLASGSVVKVTVNGTPPRSRRRRGRACSTCSARTCA